MAENFVQVPWSIESSDLDPYQFRLWVHIARVGICWQSIRTMAEACNMSVGKASETKAWLLRHGYLRHETGENDSKMGVVACSPHEQTQQECSPDEQDVHDMNKLFTTRTKRSPHERHLKKNTEVENMKKRTEEESEARANGFWAIPEGLDATDFVRAWGRWLSYVDERGLDFTETQAKLTLDELARHGAAAATESVINSIRKGWRNVCMSEPISAARASPGANGHRSAVYQPNELGEY